MTKSNEISSVFTRPDKFLDSWSANESEPRNESGVGEESPEFYDVHPIEDATYTIKNGKFNRPYRRIVDPKLYATLQVLKVNEYFDLPVTGSLEGKRGTIHSIVKNLRQQKRVDFEYKIATQAIKNNKQLRIWRLR